MLLKETLPDARAEPDAAAITPPSIAKSQVLAVFFVGFCAFLDLYVTQPLLPLLMHTFCVTEAQASLTLSATTLAVALSAPLVGLFSDRIGRKPVILGSLIALSVPTMLAATSHSLNALIGWRFLQGVFMPGVFAVTVAYLHEEYAGRGAGSVLGTYVAGSVLGGFGGRFITGLATHFFGWHAAFVALGIVNLVGALLVWQGLPQSQKFVPESDFRASLRAITAHLHNPLLLTTYLVGFNVLFGLVAAFTYVNFYLAAPPFRLNTAMLSSVFFVYLLGVVVTPMAGRWITQVGSRRPVVAGFGVSSLGLMLTLEHSLIAVIVGLALCSTGIFMCQAAATSYIGDATNTARSSAAGLYVTFYYLGGSAGGWVPGLFWTHGGWPFCVGLVVVVQMATAVVAWTRWRG